MKFDIFAYDFPHWKTHKGIGLIQDLGLEPETVILAPKKVLTHPQSKRRITPQFEYFPHPAKVLEQMGWNYIVKPHEEARLTMAEFAIILGARILPKHIINIYPKGIINIHPGILPGNRGLDNLKWAIVNKWPIGATAHWIDSRIDMGRIICRRYATIPEGVKLEGVYKYLRKAELDALEAALKWFTPPEYCEPVQYTPKLSALPDELDEVLPDFWKAYENTRKKYTNENYMLLPDVWEQATGHAVL